MPRVSRERLVQVCSELVGKELEVVSHGGKHFILKVKGSDEVIAQLPKVHSGDSRDLDIRTAQSILRGVAKGNQELLQDAKKKLRN